MSRGRLTEEVQEVAEDHLGRELYNRTELSLMAYTDYVMKNSQILEEKHLNDKDKKMLARWYQEGNVSGCMELEITKEFYNAMQAILWVSYVKAPGGEL